MLNYDDQFRHQAAGLLLCPDGDFNDRFQDYLTSIDVQIKPADLYGHRIRIHTPETGLASTTVYSSIEGYDFLPYAPTLKLFVDCHTEGSMISTVEYEELKLPKGRKLIQRFKKGWKISHETDSFRIAKHCVRFNGKIINEHKPLLQSLRLTNEVNNPIGQPMSFVVTIDGRYGKKREIFTTIKSLIVRKDHKGIATVIVIPAFCCLDSYKVHQFFIKEGDKNWQVTPSKTIGKLIMF